MEDSPMCVRTMLAASCLVVFPCLTAFCELPDVKSVEKQPLVAQVKRVVEALNQLGVPLRDNDRTAFEAAIAESDSAKSVAAIQTVLDAYCLLGVEVKSEDSVTLSTGPAKRQLVEQGWTQF